MYQQLHIYDSAESRIILHQHVSVILTTLMIFTRMTESVSEV